MTTDNKNSQRHIFLADDDEDDRSFFIEVLTEVDASVIVTPAEDGKKLMELLYAQPAPLPEVIFLDINMPRQNGFECLQEIRSNEGSLKKVPVIMFSTSNSPKTIEKARLLGATFYAVKPNCVDALRLLIKKVLLLNWSSLEKTKRFRLI